MQPSRAPHSPPQRHQRRGPTPAPDPPPAPPSSHTSLPPIRQLHPYLPPPGLSPYSAPPPPPEYSYPPGYASHLPPQDTAPTHASSLPHQPPPPTTTIPHHRDPEIYGGVDSEGDEYDQHGPPKKKRRRQALSCTECKRRKIKCDRSQPCAPCTRRGDQAKCQWHIVEPVEKYVTRAEYDELKARFEQLSALVQRFLPPGQPPPPGSAPPVGYYSMPQDMPPEAVHYPSGPPPPAPAQGYHGMMPPPLGPPQTYPGVETQGRYGVKEEARHPPRPTGTVGSPLLPTRSQQQQGAPQQDRSPTSAAQLPAGGGGGSPAAAPKKSPLSLAAITSPYNTSDQSKNYHAQTLMLGERLRPEMFPFRPEDPAHLPLLSTAMMFHRRRSTSPLALALARRTGRRGVLPRTCMSTTRHMGRGGSVTPLPVLVL